MYYFYCVDDNPLHLSRARQSIESAVALKQLSYEYEIIECANGKELINKVGTHKPRLVTMDINMPEMDGLTALVKLRAMNELCPVVMVSSEDENIIRRLGSNVRKVDDEMKQAEMMNRVVTRVKQNSEEPGKINSVLEACANLGMDPIKVAKTYGAINFIQKPYDASEAGQVLANYM